MVVSKVCLGTMHIGNLTNEAEAFQIMDKAIDMGINFFDTANIYGSVPGKTEEVIGKWLSQGNGRRDKIVLATKGYQNMVQDHYVPNEENGVSMYKFRKHMEDSLRRLRTDHVDLYQVHHIDKRVSIEEFWGALDRMVDQGYTNYIGTSNFTGWALEKFQLAAKLRGRMGIVSEQTMYNMLCRYPELEIIPACEDLGVGLIPYMPLAGGLLAGKTKQTAGFRTNQVAGEYNIAYEENEQIKRFLKLCKDINEKPNVAAAVWVLSHPVVSSVVIGIRTLEQLEDMERISELKLEEDIIKELNEIFDINTGRALRNNLETPNAFAW